MKRRPMARFLPILLLVSSGAVFAADRHVFLDTDHDGVLNDCPNPAHNAKGTSNTDELQVCSGGSSAGRVIGTAAGRVAASACTSGGGTVADLRNNGLADVDGDGTPERVYGHPQACVYNMAPSDSCDVHAGTYQSAGAECDENCGNQSQAGLEGSLGVCDKFDCFRASVVAFGEGPNLGGSGYGTAAAPGWLRAADSNGSVDSWDPNGDKDPADGRYPAILSGDSNANGAFDRTTCSHGVCSGDAFYAVIIGCGGSTSGRHFCRTTPEAGTTYVRIDSDGDGTIDRNAGVFAYNTKEVHNLRIKDLVFTRYNGGNGGIDGVRSKPGTIDLNGADDSTDGLVVDHVYLHGNDFTYGLDDVSTDRVENEGYTENHWAAFNDQANHGCTTPTEIRNSFLVQNNARLLNFDCGTNTACGCKIFFHDNRVLVDVDPAKVPTYTDTAGGVRIRSVDVAYYKNIDINPTQHRIWNNEFIVKSMGTSRSYFMDLQAFGNAQGNGNGSLWIYGNLFRDDPAASVKMKRFWQGYCDIGTASWQLYVFNNTFDSTVEVGSVCSGAGELLAETNNAFLRTTGLYQSTATTLRRSNNRESLLSSDRSVWFDPGSSSPGTHGGVLNYRARTAGPLKGTATCDPDGNGTAGVDYNGDGVNDTSWRTLSGALVSCPALTSAQDIGAIPASGAPPPDTTPPGNVQGLIRTDKKP